MIIYEAEKSDNIIDMLQSSSSICYASHVSPASVVAKSMKHIKALASLDDQDLYYVQSILVSSCWNKNDDIFDKEEIWKAKNTPEHKPTNLEHDENTIIGHITANWPITEDGVFIDKDTPIQNLPDKYHILTGSVIYTGYSSPELKERSLKLISEIEEGSKYVSMECFFKNFDYGLTNKDTGEYKVLSRNETTAHLTKHLKAYGGMGEHENYKIGRVLRNITFSGKGFVDKPANPDSIIFTKNFVQEKNDNFDKSGVFNDQHITQIAETIKMKEDNQKETETVLASDQSVSIESISEKYKLEIEELKNLAASNEDKIKAEYESVITDLRSQIDNLVASNSEKESKIQDIMNEIQGANEIIAGYKTKEEEMMKKEKKMKRMAFLIKAGLDEEEASKAVESFENLDDSTFENMAALITSVASQNKNVEESVATEKTVSTEESKSVKEEAVDASVLEDIEPSETTDIAVGTDDSEDEVFSTRAALVDFISNRLNQ